MSRKRITRSEFYPFHVTGRCNNREPFPLKLGQVWEIISLHAYWMSVFFDVQIHAFVLMPNHFHMLMSCLRMALGEPMNWFMKSVSRTVNLAAGREGHLWGGPYYPSLVNTERYYATVLRYIYCNPVRGGLVGRAEDWKFSTLSGLIGRTALPFPVHFPDSGQGSWMGDEIWESLNWINRPYSEKQVAAIRSGLRRREFAPPVDRVTRLPVDLLL